MSIQYKITVGNSGGQPLTGVTVVDSTGGTGCTFPTTWAEGYSSPGCTYNRTAPNVPNGQSQISYPNVLTVDSAETNPEQDSITVTVQPPPPNWKVDVYVSPFALGDDGDGTGGTADFKNVTVVNQGVNATLTNESAWFQVVVRNIGGSTANGVTISSTLGPLPFGQNTANAVVRCGPTDDGRGRHLHLPLQGRRGIRRDDPEHRHRPVARTRYPPVATTTRRSTRPPVRTPAG